MLDGRRKNMRSILVCALALAGLAKADQLYHTWADYVYYGTLTVLNPDGSLNSTLNIVTSDGADFTGLPSDYAAFEQGVLPQFQSDIQDSYANLPSWLFTGLASLEDSNGFGFPPLITMPGIPPDPAAVSFDNQLANIGGPYTTLSDTGFQMPPFSQAYCDYVNTIIPGACTGPADGGFEFTYQVGGFSGPGDWPDSC
jgi:hypothetical protein